MKQNVRRAREVADEIERRISYEMFLLSSADTIAELWSLHKGRHTSVEELIEVFERPPEDQERQELLAWSPGSEAEMREALSRRIDQEED